MQLLHDKFSVSDLRQLTDKQLYKIAQEIRKMIIETVAKNGGHLASSLGTVEISIALHVSFSTPGDILIWDIGHQAYAHKIVTKRASKFNSLRKKGGLLGFLSREESKFDPFGAGHSSTSISAILGFSKVAQLKKIKRWHIAVIGDAALASGMAMEALNRIQQDGERVLLVFNQNSMSIDENTGALNNVFQDSNKAKHFFELFGLDYYFLKDGHDIKAIQNNFDTIKKLGKNAVLHLKTTKGKGLEIAENDPVTWHSPGYFEVQTLERKKTYAGNLPKVQQVVNDTLEDLANRGKHFVVITPAMKLGSGLTSFAQKYPEKIVDVGIAEQHALTYSAGISAAGVRPFCVIYSTFLQRAYDQLIHDIAVQNLPITLLIDRAGYVGADGATHHGFLDTAFLCAIPNMVVLSPINILEMKDMIISSMKWSFPVAIRYPRQRSLVPNLKNSARKFEWKKVVKMQGVEKDDDQKIVAISTGFIGQVVAKATRELAVSHYHFPVIKPLNEKKLLKILKKNKTLFIVEEGVEAGGFTSSILQFVAKNRIGIKVETIAFPDGFVEQASRMEQLEEVGMSEESIRERLLRYLN